MNDTDLQIHLDIFDGPLDLLLHLVRENEYDIFDIPIAAITKQYNAYLDVLRDLNLNIAAEYLVMSATLMRIKSRMLLPTIAEGEEGDEEDPRAELLAQLLEYQRYKEAAMEMSERPLLGRDVFARKFPSQELNDAQLENTYLEVDIFQLLQALQHVIKNLPKDEVHRIQVTGMSIREQMSKILEIIHQRNSVVFVELFETATARGDVIGIFLAILELARQTMIKITQIDQFGPIRIVSLLTDEGDESVH